MGRVIFMSTSCRFEGCAKAAKHRGYCGAHYQRLRKSGELITGRYERGPMVKHALYPRWSKLRCQDGLVPEWRDFWVFVDGVGDPMGRTKILRMNQGAPLGPDNFYWAEALTGARKAAYYRDWYKKSPKQRDKRYQKAYGIGIEECDALLAAQGGVCAICEQPESKIVRAAVNEDLRRLAVDHDHSTGEVRGLLCADCNRALGIFNDDPTVLFRAIQYLTKSKAVGRVS